MTDPVRIRLSRARGWRLPENAVSVARPGKLGNPFVVGKFGTRAECVRALRELRLACGRLRRSRNLACRRLGPSGECQAQGSLLYRTSWPRPATQCNLVPLWKGEFHSFNDWVNFATTRLTGTTDGRGREVSAICVDALGRRCSIGGDFMRARDEDAFPVRYFWECVPASEAEPTP